MSNHPGYILKQPQEFFHKYGDYVLRLMQLVRLGYSDNAYDIPAIDTFNILWKYKTHAGGNINRDTIRSLIEKAIAYIQKVSPPRWIMEPGLTRIQSAAIKDFLLVQHGDNAEGNLHRHIDSQQCVSWRCQRHKEQYFAQKPLEDLEVYVGCRQGHIDMQQARLSVELQSYAESNEFQNLLTDVKLPFNISIKLNWNTTRSYVEKLCQDVAQLKTVTLDIDGITPSIYPQGYLHYTRNIFVDKVLSDTGLQLITAFNYPRRQEQCIYIGNFSLQSKLAPLRSSHSWVELRTDLDRFGDLLSKAQVPSECDAAAMVLQLVQKKHGLSDTTSITIHGDKWAAVFSLKERAVIEAYSHDAACPRAVLSSGTLRKLTVDLSDLEFDKEFFNIVKTNNGLRELNASILGHDIFHYFKHVKAWQLSSGRGRRILIYKLQDMQGRIMARMMAQRPGSEGSGNTLDVGQFDITTPSQLSQMEDTPMTVTFLNWDHEQVSTLMSNNYTTLLDMSTPQHPLVLNLFTLDAPHLSDKDVVSIQNVLCRSQLATLNVICTPIDPTLSKSITQVLGSVRWDTLKSLVLTGNNIDGWAQLWNTYENQLSDVVTNFGLRLQSFHLRGTGPAPQILSHPSVLFFHRLIYTISGLKVHLENLGLQDKRDWTPLIEGVNPREQHSIFMCARTATQLLSDKAESDLSEQIGKTARTDLTSNTLEIHFLHEQDLVQFQCIPRHFNVEHLHVVCTPFGPSLSSNIVGVIRSLPWSKFKSVELSGVNIMGWIRLLNSISDLETMVFSQSLHSLAVGPFDKEGDQELYRIVKCNTELQTLGISTQGRGVLYHAENISHLRGNSSLPLRLTLFERMNDSTHDRFIAQAVLGGERGAIGINHHHSEVTTEYEFLLWRQQLSDHSALFLDRVTQQHSSILSFLSLDITSLSKVGLSLLKNTLCQSNLERLCVICTHINPSMSDLVAQVLGSVSWNTLKSLALFGDNIDSWIQLRSFVEAPRLLCLEIHGTGSTLQELTHSSVLFIHQLAYKSSLEKLEITGVRLQSANDWTLIVDAVDPAYLKTLGLCGNCSSQLQSNPVARDLLGVKSISLTSTLPKTLVVKPKTIEDIAAQEQRSAPERAQKIVPQLPVAYGTAGHTVTQATDPPLHISKNIPVPRLPSEQSVNTTVVEEAVVDETSRHFKAHNSPSEFKAELRVLSMPNFATSSHISVIGTQRYVGRLV
ncbi:hypothetical protein BGZ82_000464 [Podila clonocystis]|nr:hypothetical protein BGZ82_000464 [Podila clonocystis]